MLLLHIRVCVWIHLYFIYGDKHPNETSFEKLNIRCKGGNKDVTIGYVNKNYVSYVGTFTECDNLNANLQGRKIFALCEINFENLCCLAYSDTRSYEDREIFAPIFPLRWTYSFHSRLNI